MHPSPSAAGSCCAAPTSRATAGPQDGRFSLTDHFGRPVDETSYGGRHLLVLFGFSHCAVVCPRELAKLGQALALLGDLAAQVQPLYITVDPARDDPDTLQRFLADRPGGFVGLTGAPDVIDAVKSRYRVFAASVADPEAAGGYRVPHTAFAYLIAPGGRHVAHFADALDAPEVAARLRRLLARDASPSSKAPR